jgi:septal ring factor EnvC (AmiA/AmiB activator)
MFRFFTANSQVINSQIRALQERIDAWEAFVPQNRKVQQRLETEIADAREEIAALDKALHKLRGQFHGPKSQEVKREAAFPPLTTKEALRRRAGIIAGQPAPHAGSEPSYETGDS